MQKKKNPECIPTRAYLAKEALEAPEISAGINTKSWQCIFTHFSPNLFIITFQTIIYFLPNDSHQ